MAYPEYFPVPELLPYIDRYTFMSVNGTTPPEQCIPNGFVRLYIIDGESDLEVILPDGKRFILEDAIEGHPNEQLHSTQVNQKLSLIMCSFYPASFFQAFGMPIHYLNNQLVRPENIFGNAYKHLKEQLLNTAENSRKKDLLDNFFKKSFLRKSIYDAGAIGSLQHLILRQQGNVNVNSLYSQFSRSQRSLERDFLEQVGVGSKYFCRILRFNHAYALKRKFQNKSWNEILYNCGYYDQSHFIKEFKGFMNSSPQVYLREHDNNLGLFTGISNLGEKRFI